MSWYEDMEEKMRKEWREKMPLVWETAFEKQREINNFREGIVRKFVKLMGYDPDDVAFDKFPKGLRQVFSGDEWWLEYFNKRVSFKYKGTEVQIEFENPEILPKDKPCFFAYPKEWIMDMKIKFPAYPLTSTGFYLLDMSQKPETPTDRLMGMALAFSEHYKKVKLTEEKKMKKDTIKFTKQEMQTQTRIERAEQIISTCLHPKHEMRNDWLELFGTSDEAKQLRKKRNMIWDEETEAAKLNPYKEGEMIAIQRDDKIWVIAEYRKPGPCETDVEVKIGIDRVLCKIHKPLSAFNK